MTDKRDRVPPRVELPPGTPEAPLFEPDPELVGHLEGSRFWTRRFRRGTERQLDESRRDWAATHPTPN